MRYWGVYFGFIHAFEYWPIDHGASLCISNEKYVLLNFPGQDCQMLHNSLELTWVFQRNMQMPGCFPGVNSWIICSNCYFSLPILKTNHESIKQKDTSRPAVFVAPLYILNPLLKATTKPVRELKHKMMDLILGLF